MSQQNNEIQESLLKQEDFLKRRIKDDPAFQATVRVMLADYVVNNLSIQQLSEKYSYPPSLVKKISTKFNFYNRKQEYEDKLLKSALRKTQNKHVELIATITKSIEIQVKRIIKKQMEDESYIISNNNMKDLLSSLSIFSREYRLDNDKPTENSAVQVLVSFANDVPIVTENHHNKTILVEPENTPEPTPSIPENDTMTNEDYKDADAADDHIDNSSFFGVIDDENS